MVQTGLNSVTQHPNELWTTNNQVVVYCRWIYLLLFSGPNGGGIEQCSCTLFTGGLRYLACCLISLVQIYRLTRQAKTDFYCVCTRLDAISIMAVNKCTELLVTAIGTGYMENNTGYCDRSVVLFGYWLNLNRWILLPSCISIED